MSSRDSMGRPLCQVVGCHEPGRPRIYDFEHLQVEVVLCGRHARDLREELGLEP